MKLVQLLISFILSFILYDKAQKRLGLSPKPLALIQFIVKNTLIHNKLGVVLVSLHSSHK